VKRWEAIEVIAGLLNEDEYVISANGMISREMCAIRDRSHNFYMLGSMGLASSIGLGLALSVQNKKVVVIDGDGNVLMNLGALTTIGKLCPKNFIHVVLDNESHGSTGGQPTASMIAELEEIAKASGFKVTRRVYRIGPLEEAMRELLTSDGPSFLLVKVERGGEPVPRVPYEPEVVKDRFKKAFLIIDLL
jgi:sulfopyruvate decarboxylase subunit beta